MTFTLTSINLPTSMPSATDVRLPFPPAAIAAAKGSAWAAWQIDTGLRKPVDLVNARASIASESLEVGVFGRNIFNKKFVFYERSIQETVVPARSIVARLEITY